MPPLSESSVDNVMLVKVKEEAISPSASPPITKECGRTPKQRGTGSRAPVATSPPIFSMDALTDVLGDCKFKIHIHF